MRNSQSASAARDVDPMTHQMQCRSAAANARADAQLVLIAAKSTAPVHAIQPARRGRPARQTGPSPSTPFLHRHISHDLIQFHLQRITGALYVERQQCSHQGTQTLQAIRFNHLAAFHAWCDEDPLRFVQPHLLARVRREGNVLWDREPTG